MEAGKGKPFEKIPKGRTRKMKLEFLGTGAADYHLERHEHEEGFRRYSSALLDGRLLFDPGPHIFHYQKTFGKDDLFRDLRYVLVTHSHGDHLNMDSVRGLLKICPECQFFGNVATARMFEEAGIPFTVLELGKEVAIGDYLVTPLRSNHTGNFDDDFLYSLVSGDKKLFYGTDTGLLPEPTWNYIKDRLYDLFVMELTIGDHPDAPHLHSHMTLLTFTLMVKTMKKRYHTIKEGGAFVTTHMARNWHDHEHLAEQLAPFGAVPAYDGYVVEIL
jgi:phosphoribosyl 1,2-cyclic phosphate phosphodiesterase